MPEIVQVETACIPIALYDWLYQQSSGFFAPGKSLTDAALQAMHTAKPDDISGPYAEITVDDKALPTLKSGMRTAIIIVGIGIAGYFAIKAIPWGKVLA